MLLFFGFSLLRQLHFRVIDHTPYYQSVEGRLAYDPTKVRWEKFEPDTAQ